MVTFLSGERFDTINGTLDPQLIGHWLTSESHASGSFSTLIEISITFLADGRALEFEGRAQGPHTTTYYWAVEAGQLFFGQAPGQYAPVGTYVIERDSLFITHLDGKRDVWQRAA